MKGDADRGFTLLEVLVALAVVGIGLGAALRLLDVTQRTLWQREQRMVADWVARNVIVAMRLDEAGTGSGRVAMAGREWHWSLTKDPADMTGRRLRIRVWQGERADRWLIDRVVLP